MPGILYHLYFAKCCNQLLQDRKQEIDIRSFYSGSLLPDYCQDKDATHFYVPLQKGFLVPDLAAARATIANISDKSLALGIYSHLYLDRHYIERFLIPSFTWDIEHDLVLSKRNGHRWTKEEFFGSKESGLYQGYNEVNRRLIDEGYIDVDMLNYDVIPRDFIHSGVAIFDNLKDKDWLGELNYYLGLEAPYTGIVFDFDELAQFIEGLAADFVSDVAEYALQ